MNVDTMRNIDHYVGVPLTFLSTFITKFLPFKKTSTKNPERVLLIELSEMGSAVIADPAMQKLKANGAELFFVIFKKNIPSLKLLNSVSESNIFTIREDSLFTLAWDTLRFLQWCRKNRIDTVIDLELFSRFTALLSGYSGACRRVGFYRYHNEGLYRGEMLTHRVAYNAHMHIAKNFIALVNSLYSDEQELPYSKSAISDEEICIQKAPIAPEVKTRVQEAIKTLYPSYTDETEIILINANASDLLPQRRWSAHSYQEVIQKILDYKPEALVLLTGAPSESDGLAVLANGVNHPQCINFAGKIAFLELPALYNLSKLMLTNDSGPAHFASITSMPTFVIFGPETPALYASLGETTPIYAGLACSPCVSAANHRKTSCTDNQCLKVLTPELVFNTLKSSL